MPDYEAPKISQIRVAGRLIGLRNLHAALENVRLRNLAAERELKGALIEETRNMKNYIPDSAEDRYGEALLREYRRFLGDPVEEEEGSLSVRVLGMGCPNCHRLADEVMNALTELNLEADFEHVTEIDRIAEYGGIGTPALVINNKIRSVGRVPARKKIKKWLEEETGKEKGL